MVAARRKLTAEEGGIAVPPPPKAAFGIPEDHPETERVRRRLTPHPAGPYDSPLRLRNPAVGNGRPCTCIACTAPLHGPLEASRRWVRRQSGWSWQEIATGHGAVVTAPAEPARMLLAAA